MKPKESTTSVTIRVPNEVLAIVDKIAADEDRSRAYVIKRYLSVLKPVKDAKRIASETINTNAGVHID